MIVCICYCRLHTELKMSRTSTNPGRMFWGSDPTYQEQYYMKNRSTNVDHGRHGKHGRHGRQGRSSINVLMICLFEYYDNVI
ncbi:hypothetical protein R3W88_026886 [Solanum pinnatisectum]|uniref:Uncharacterized protein n=1 Tax=Solanum pinnatisectum TaxID=50273 RepID=A0AAV9LI93_9SOLN|nr:hypothetical protein R3W88_026886 [Solanum pinnatisectum]